MFVATVNVHLLEVGERTGKWSEATPKHSTYATRQPIIEWYLCPFTSSRIQSKQMNKKKAKQKQNKKQEVKQNILNKQC